MKLDLLERTGICHQFRALESKGDSLFSDEKSSFQFQDATLLLHPLEEHCSLEGEASSGESNTVHWWSSGRMREQNHIVSYVTAARIHP